MTMNACGLRVVTRGQLPDDLAAARFARRGLAGLIAWPAAEPVFWVELIGASRPAWTPHGDPRNGASPATYRLLLRGSEGQRISPSRPDGLGRMKMNRLEARRKS